jgi:hypothetical protein
MVLLTVEYEYTLVFVAFSEHIQNKKAPFQVLFIQPVSVWLRLNFKSKR